ncbi:hypothetical protein D917_04876, partial [Trichinella nativa]
MTRGSRKRPLRIKSPSLVSMCLPASANCFF